MGASYSFDNSDGDSWILTQAVCKCQTRGTSTGYDIC